MVSTRARRWRTAGYVVPLFVVIGAALYWSSYATFQYVEGPRVPGHVAWTMFVSTDGAVIVTTPIILSTVLSARVRRWAGAICAGALLWSMFINQAETGWVGIAPSIIAGALIHVVGLVLRDLRRLETADSRSVPLPTGSADTSVEVEQAMPSADPVAPPVSPPPVVDEPDVMTPKARNHSPATGASASAGISPPVAPSLLPVGLSAREIVFRLLNEAHAKDLPEPSGPALTAAVRNAGYEVNDEYGRTTKARWRKSREEAAA
jgi:hypothetical protein